MKRWIGLTLTVVLVLAAGIMAFADTTNTEVPNWFKEMIQWKKEKVSEAVESNLITEEQAEYWNERLDAMEKFHEENGFDFPGGCRGFGRKGNGFGSGMMGGYWNRQGL